MEAKAVLLMIIVILIALHLNMEWLAMLLGVVSFFMAITMISTQKKEEEIAPAGGEEEEEQVLTPVVVQDVGEPPNLYPKKFKLKVSDQYKGKAWFEVAVGTVANIIGFMKHIFTGKPPRS